MNLENQDLSSIKEEFQKKKEVVEKQYYSNKTKLIDLIYSADIGDTNYSFFVKAPEELTVTEATHLSNFINVFTVLTKNKELEEVVEYSSKKVLSDSVLQSLVYVSKTSDKEDSTKIVTVNALIERDNNFAYFLSDYLINSLYYLENELSSLKKKALKHL